MIRGAIARYQDIQWPLLTLRCTTVMLLVVIITMGCGPGKIVFAPEERSKLKDEPEIIAFRYEGTVLAAIPESPSSGVYTYERIVVREEPLIPLMESFFAAIKAELNLGTIRTLQEPRHHEPDYRFELDQSIEQEKELYRIKRTFQSGMVFDFDKSNVVFAPDPSQYRSIAFTRTDSQVRFIVQLWARARLIKVEEQKVLWQGVCIINDGGMTLVDFREAGNPLVQEKLDRAIKACSQEWISQFMGK